jgi:predicted acyltransferase
MFLMIFVNDFSANVPNWLGHATRLEDMLGFSDIILPSFLFIVGMSIPHAIENRFAKGDTHLQILGHIMLRVFALIVMGIFQVNLGAGGISPEVFSGLDARVVRPVFAIIMVVAFFLIWNVYPRAKDRKKYLFLGLQLLGVAILVYLAIIYRNRDGLAILFRCVEGACLDSGAAGRWILQTRWYGILGLIGWAYGICALIYLFISRGRLTPQIIAWVVIVIFSMFGASGRLMHDDVNLGFMAGMHLGFMQNVIPDNGTLQAFTMSGVILSTLFTKWLAAGKSVNKIFLPALGLGAAMIVLGFASRQIWHISKLVATPTWMFFCVGISVIAYMGFFWLVDVKGKKNWFRSISPAGTATLTCFLMPTIIYALIQITRTPFPEIVLVYPITQLLNALPFVSESVVESFAQFRFPFITTYPIGLLKCVALSFFVIGVVHLIGKIGIRLKV